MEGEGREWDIALAVESGVVCETRATYSSGNPPPYHRTLRVWQEAMNLAVLVYDSTSAYPKTEAFGMTAQVRRAAVSVACNIAEGSGRRTTKDFLHFLYIARGSLREPETLVELSRQIGLSSGSLTAVGKMLTRLIQPLEFNNQQLATSNP